MIQKFNQFNESLRDKMVGKSEEDILNSLGSTDEERLTNALKNNQFNEDIFKTILLSIKEQGKLEDIIIELYKNNKLHNNLYKILYDMGVNLDIIVPNLNEATTEILKIVDAFKDDYQLNLDFVRAINSITLRIKTKNKMYQGDNRIPYDKYPLDGDIYIYLKFEDLSWDISFFNGDAIMKPDMNMKTDNVKDALKIIKELIVDKYNESIKINKDKIQNIENMIKIGYDEIEKTNNLSI